MKRFFAVFLFSIQLWGNLQSMDFAPGELEALKDRTRGLFQDTLDDLISDPVLGYKILEDPFYYYTKPLRKRDIVELLSGSPLLSKKRFIFFYHETSEGVYFQGKTALGDYVNILQKSLIEELQERIPPGIDIPEVLPLFAPVKAQERRIGTVFSYKTEVKDWHVSLKLPFLYQEYNFYLSPSDRAAIQNNELFKPRKVEGVAIEDGPKEKPKGQGVKEFAKQHLLSDKIGFSDLHVTFEKIIKQFPYSELSGGFDVTVPTAFAFKKGVVGVFFDKKRANPRIDLHADIVDLYGDAEYDQLKQNVLDFGVAALDRLSTIVLEQPLGNNYHPGVAPFIRLIFEPRQNFGVSTQLKADFLMPVPERRFFKEAIDKDTLESLVGLEDLTEAEARAHVQFLSEQLVVKLFPKSYTVTVFPGVIFQSDVALFLKSYNWTFECGLQTWYQSAENFFSLPKTAAVLEIEKGRREAAFQNKLWFGILRQGEVSAFELQIAGVPQSYAIGKSILVTLTYSWEF